ncbi:MAG TPA: NAD-dependent epimerase/dehydratase family protein [Candidatus Nanopelagicales bacterium]|nr:NAD-dependent epimerase/dehydratase family protein [Candidatus Nanopelagicales bacterium]
MKVLLTGSSSLLGAQTVRALVQRGDTVAVMQRRASAVADELGLTQHLGDVVDPQVAAAAVEGADTVIHLAARVGVVGTRRQFFDTNVVGTRVMLAAAKDAGVQRFVFVSSPSVAHTGRALAGCGAQPADPRHAKGEYSKSKALAEKEVLAADGTGITTIAVRPHLVWGPGDTQLVGRIAERARQGRLALVAGGRPLIDTTYLDNAVDALVAAADRAEAGHGRAFIVSNGEPRTVEEMIARICEAAGERPPERSVPRAAAWMAGAVAETAWKVAGRDDDPPMTRFLAGQLGTAHWFDLRETREVLQWRPAVSLDEGFARLAASFA